MLAHHMVSAKRSKALEQECESERSPADFS